MKKFSFICLLVFCSSGFASTNLDPSKPREEGIVVLESWKNQLTHYIAFNKKNWSIFGKNFITLTANSELLEISPTVSGAVKKMVQDKIAITFGHYIQISASNFQTAVADIDEAEKDYYSKKNSFCASILVERDQLMYFDASGKVPVYSINPEVDIGAPPVCRFEYSILYKECRLSVAVSDYYYQRYTKVEKNGEVLFANTTKEGGYEAMLTDRRCTGPSGPDQQVMNEDKAIIQNELLIKAKADAKTAAEKLKYLHNATKTASGRYTTPRSPYTSTVTFSNDSMLVDVCSQTWKKTTTCTSHRLYPNAARGQFCDHEHTCAYTSGEDLYWGDNGVEPTFFGKRIP